MQQWANIAGLTLTAIGILVGFYLPRMTSYYGKDAKREIWLQRRFIVGFTLVFIGTGLQIFGAWPR